MIDWLFVYQMTMPESTAEIPSVTISEFTPIFATVTPMTTPTSGADREADERRRRTSGTPSRAMNPAQSTCDEPGDRPDREVELAADERDHDREREDADARPGCRGRS